MLLCGGRARGDGVSEVRKSISFKCRQCEGTAEIIESDGRIEGVHCPACGVALDGVDARLMVRELQVQYVRQEGSNLNRIRLRKARIGRVPLRKVTNEFSDPRWPFTLIADDDA